MTPKMLLLLAQQRVATAEETCAHWDYETQPAPSEHNCCAELLSAKHNLKLRRREFTQSEARP